MFDFKSIANECIKCGKCIPGCTIHQVNEDEVTSPRGFIELLGAYQDGKLELDKTAKDIFESCFLCTACVEVCPNSLPTDMVIEQVRNDIRKKYGLEWYKKTFFFLLRHRKVMDFMAKLGWVFQTCAIKINEKNSFATPRFSLPIVKKDRALPYANKKSFLNSYPQTIKPKNKEAKKVAIFIGCLANYSYTNIGDSLVKILKKLDYEIFIPKKQVCCGAPAYFTGDFDTVEYLAKKNIEYFESFLDEVEAIIIPEATCSAMINIDYEHFFHDNDEWKQRAKKVAKKVFLATKWLHDNTKLKELLSNSTSNIQNLTLTYHDPCHAKKMQGVSKEPRNLLKQNYEIVEMSDPNRCCGFGGVTMQTKNYDLALKAGRPKAKMIKETNAKIVSAECSACRMQIVNSLYQEGSHDIVFQNPIELIAKALENVE